MSSFFRGALNLIQGEAGGSADGTFHPLVGKELHIGETRLRVKSVVAEGGFAVVFSAQDQNGKLYALKQQIANDLDTVQALANEVGVMEELRGHQNIVGYYNMAKTKAANGGSEYLMLMELCSGGTVVDLLKTTTLSPTQALRIFYAACKAVKHMHCREKPITHRDIKVENLLFTSQGAVKLCDFGSSTRAVFRPDDSWSSGKRTALIEEMQKHTTPMYRAPEIQDEYMNLPVGPQQDVWALGCVLFYLCYRVHPFEDSAKLRIINAKYQIPSQDVTFTMFIPLIQSCLKINPVERPTIADLVERTEALAIAMEINPDESVPGVGGGPVTQSESPSNVRAAANRPKPEGDVSQQASAVFGALKGQGMSLFKNIKDRSAAVVQTVQSTYGSSGPDVVWLTSRMVLAPLAEHVPEALASQNEDSLRNFASGMGRPFLMANFSYRKLRCEYPTAPLESILQPPLQGPPPTVNYLLRMCRAITQFLRQNPNGFVIFYGLMPHAVLLSSALIIYNHLLARPINALELITERKKMPTALPPSFHRALDVLTKIVNSPRANFGSVVHNCPTMLDKMIMEPAPLFNRTHTGCRPFAEVFIGGTKFWSTAKDYQDIKAFEPPEARHAEIAFDNLPVGDDVTIIVYHARWSKMQNKQLQIPMFSFGFHANFCDRNQNALTFHVGDLDISGEDATLFPEGFKVVLNLRIDAIDRGFDNNTGVAVPDFMCYEADSVQPKYLVDGGEEYDNVKLSFESGEQSRPKPPRPPAHKAAPPANVAPAPVGNTDFFSSLSWGQTASTDNKPRASPVSKPAPAPPVQADLFGFSPVEVAPVRDASPVTIQRPTKAAMDAEAYERMYGIRVGKVDVDEDSAKYQFDCDKPIQHETPILGGGPSPVQSSVSNTGSSDIDLLGLGEMSIGGSTQPSNKPAVDPFADLLGYGSTTAPVPASAAPNTDLFGDFSTAAPMPMHRNVSAPTLPQQNGKSSTFDPFADFLNSTPMHSVSNPSSKPGSAGNSGTTTPKPSRPNYSRSAFDSINSTGGNNAKPKVTADSFGDLLSSHGFAGSSFNNAPKTIADMRRADEIRDLDPVEIKIRDWTKGKEKNVRALLGSLNDVLWEGADNWQQPPMGDLLNATQVKKWYRKAALVVHPDKQTGTPHEELARAVFTQLNEAWTAFEQAGSPSIA